MPNSTKTLLIAAAAPSNLNGIIAGLNGLGFEVITASSTAQALEHAGRTEIHLAIVDLDPAEGFDGPACAQELSIAFQLPLVWLTGGPTPERLALVQALPASGFLFKTAPVETLLPAIANALRIAGLSAELAASRAAQEQQQFELARFASAVEQSPVSIVITNLKGEVEYVNPHFTRVTGYTIDEIVGQNPRILKTGFTSQQEYTTMWDAVLAGSVWNTNFRNKKKSGELYWESAVISPIYDSQGDVVNLLGIKQDISQQKELENKIAEQRDFLAQIFDVLGSGLTVTNQTGQFEMVNKAYLHLLGYSLEEMLEKRPADITASEDLDVLRQARTDRQTGKTTTYEHHVVAADGSKIPVLVTGVPRWQNGEVSGAIASIIDLTAIKNAEAELRTALEREQILQRDIYHRTKNHLTQVVGLLILQEAQLRDPYDVGLLQEIENRVRSMALVNEFLYKSENLNAVSISGYIKRLINHLSSAYNTQTVQFITKIDDIQLTANKAIACGLIVTELISNALKYAFQKSQPGEITVEMCTMDNRYILVVRDNGAGFPENTDWRSSASLGLQLVRMLTQQLNGDFMIEQSAGTCCTVNFAM